MTKRSHRFEKMARVYDEEILPVWSQRFGRMLLRELELPPKAVVLDVACGTGYPATEILKELDDGGRVIAIEAIGALLDVARKKFGELSGKRIFFRTETLSSKLAFADEVYDLVVSNLGLLERDDPPAAVCEFARVTKPGGHVAITLPLAGTFAEFYDVYREVLTKADRDDLLAKLEAHVARMPTPEKARAWLEGAELEDVEVEVEEFRLLFRSSREFFFAPVIEYGPLAAWKEIAGKGEQMQEIFWQIKNAIDAYYEGRAFDVSVVAGCLRGNKAAKFDLENTPIAASKVPVDDAGPEATIVEKFHLSEDEDDDETN
ncbi:MAG: methyltransferase domain-containing protein [Deltaproteobacteria bacterium]|nr:methyltransferase domain-containing protein [Deltaproteobacteria bacterium]